MYDGTKSYGSTFRDTRSQSLSGQMVMLSDLVPSTDYRVIVTAINTAGFRKSSDPVIGTTLTGKLHYPTPEAEASSPLTTIPQLLAPPALPPLYSSTNSSLISVSLSTYSFSSSQHLPLHLLIPSPLHLTYLPFTSSTPQLLTSSSPTPAPPAPLDPLTEANQTGGPRTYTLILLLVSSLNGPIR